MSTIEQHHTALEERIPWGQLLAYGMGGLVPVALFNIAGQLMGLIGNISLGLSAVWLGIILIIPRLWDAFSDPIMGHLSDNTRTRWGRRRPYILIGGITAALSFVGMWWVPRGESFISLFPSESAYNWFQLAFILTGLLAFFTACTVFEIPHGALGMEMTEDYHERTRLFSAKSFFGNLFALGTPWLVYLSGLEIFRGPGGDLADGMRYVSLIIAAALIPLTCWWFVALKEPGFSIISDQEKSSFWEEMRTTMSNRTFLSLVVIIFALAMGFNFVSLFNYYIAIFYLYDGDAIAAGTLLGFAGTTWAVTAVLAVFPLNWISKRVGKSTTLLIAILLMACAQLLKIVCYNPTFPYLVLLPTVMLSAGMLMFFTLGSSMIGDVCDEDDLKTGTRSEGSYYSIFWWFIKMGTAFASLVTGALLAFVDFDEKQTVSVDALRASISVMKSEVESWASEEVAIAARASFLEGQWEEILEEVEKLSSHLKQRLDETPKDQAHTQELSDCLRSFRSLAETLRSQTEVLVSSPSSLVLETERMLDKTALMKRQSARTLFYMRLVEIGLPLVLSAVSIFFTLRYPLTEQRCYEIKESLKTRRMKDESLTG